MLKGGLNEIKEKLELIESWVADGVTNDEIAKRLNVSKSTFYRYKSRCPELAAALKVKESALIDDTDSKVELSLFKKSTGYNVGLKKTFKLKVVDYDPETGKKLREYEELQTGIDEVHVSPDIRAQIFWLKNRKPKDWNDKLLELPDEIEEEDNLYTAIAKAVKMLETGENEEEGEISV